MKILDKINETAGRSGVELSEMEKGTLLLMLTRGRLYNILSKMWVVGIIPKLVIHKIIKSIIKQVDMQTGLLDKIDILENEDFMEDVKQLKMEHNIGSNSNVVYIGSNDDTCVRNEFPGTLHVDIDKPQRMPRNFNFVQTDASKLPKPDSSVDLAIFKGLVDILVEPMIIKELQRVLKGDGKILSYNIYRFDFSIEPTSIDEAAEQNRDLREIVNLYSHGFYISKRFKNGTVLIERGTDDDEKDYFEKILTRNRDILYKLIPLEGCTVSAACILEEFGLPLHIFRYITWEECETLLQPIKSKIPTETYETVESNLKHFRSGVPEEDKSRSKNRILQNILKSLLD